MKNKGKLTGLIASTILLFALTNSIIAQTGDVRFVHDPCIIKSGEYYYIFSTGDRIEMRRSKDLQSWDRLNQVFDSIPEWGKEEVPGVSNIWAPDIFYRDSTYYLYYSLSTFGSNHSRIGVATNKTLDPDSPDYEWVDQGKVIGSSTPNNYNAIDPNVAEDSEGRLWLSFGSFWSGIKIIELDPTTMKPYANANVQSIAERANYGPIEAPYIISRNGYFYLFVSFDFCCEGVNSTYKVMVGRSTSITGPYKDRNDVEMTSGGGTRVIKRDERWRGPGHCAVLLDGDSTWLVHHAYDAEANGVATLRIEKLIWDEEDWPVLESTLSVGENEQSSISNTFVLNQNFPNPFNPSTTIEYQIPKSQFVTLKVSDVLGREVSTLVDEYKPAGSYEVNFDGSSIGSGIYFYKITSGNFVQVRKMLLIK